MLMRLQRYNVNVGYNKGSSLHLDTLSRATRPVTDDSKQTNFEVFRLNIDHEECANDGITSKTLTEVKRHTLNDTDLVELTNVVSMGWPEWKSQVRPSGYYM